MATDFIDGSNKTLHRRVVFRCGKDVVEGRRGNDTGHDA